MWNLIVALIHICLMADNHGHFLCIHSKPLLLLTILTSRLHNFWNFSRVTRKLFKWYSFSGVYLAHHIKGDSESSHGLLKSVIKNKYKGILYILFDNKSWFGDIKIILLPTRYSHKKSYTEIKFSVSPEMQVQRAPPGHWIMLCVYMMMKSANLKTCYPYMWDCKQWGEYLKDKGLEYHN